MRNSKKVNVQIETAVLIVIFQAIASYAHGQTVFPATSPATAPSFTRAVLVERYDEDGAWRKVPRKAIITGDSADRLAHAFPEIEMESRPPFIVIHDPQRFEITLTRGDGKEFTIFINPELTWGWDVNNLFKVDCQQSKIVLDLAKTAHEDGSLLIKFAPAVKVEIIEREDESMRWRQVPKKITYEGLQAELLARGFPEIGLKRIPQLADAGGYRFEVIFTRENGERVDIHVKANAGAKWIWYEGNSYWELSSDTAGLLVGLCRDAKEDPSAALK